MMMIIWLRYKVVVEETTTYGNTLVNLFEPCMLYGKVHDKDDTQLDF